MASFKQFCQQLPLFPIFTGISLAFGLLVPTIFEWGEKPAARSRHPEMEKSALTIIILTLAVVVVTWFLRRGTDGDPTTEPITSSQPFQFGLRELLIATTILAVLLGIGPFMKLETSSLVVSVVAGAVLAYSFRYERSVRSRTGSLLASLFLPFFWVVLYNRPFGQTSGLLQAIPIGPAILPAMWMRGHVDDASGVATVIVIVELLLGVWLARRGGTVTLIYLTIVLLFSGFNSFVLHALYRM